MPTVSEIQKASGVKDEKKIFSLLRSSEKFKDKIKDHPFKGWVVDGDINEIVAFIKLSEAAEKELAEARKEEEAKAEAERLKAKKEYDAEVAKILITSGHSFEGYRITKYSGYISGDDAISVSRGFDGWKTTGADVGEYLLQSLTIIRQNAIRELKEAAVDLGCNAVIGVDFDYIDLAPEAANSSGGTTYYPYVFCVTANGTAVTIEECVH